MLGFLLRGNYIYWRLGAIAKYISNYPELKMKLQMLKFKKILKVQQRFLVFFIIQNPYDVMGLVNEF